MLTLCQALGEVQRTQNRMRHTVPAREELSLVGETDMKNKWLPHAAISSSTGVREDTEGTYEEKGANSAEVIQRSFGQKERIALDAEEWIWIC